MNNQNTKPENYSTDQTDFSAQEPLYEGVSVPTQPVDPASLESTEEPSFFKSKMFKVGAALLAGLSIIILITVVFLMNAYQSEQTGQPTPSPSSRPTSIDPLQQRINDLYQQVEKADPSVDELPLPPVDLTTILEE